MKKYNKTPIGWVYERSDEERIKDIIRIKINGEQYEPFDFKITFGGFPSFTDWYTSIGSGLFDYKKTLRVTKKEDIKFI